MKILFLYRPNAEFATTTEQYIEEYKKHHDSTNLETLDVDSTEGITLAGIYDIMEFPAVIVSDDNGTMQKIWQGQDLPLMDEVAAYANS